MKEIKVKFFPEDEFINLLNKLESNEDEGEYNREFASVYIDPDSRKLLEKHLDCEITSIHSDDCDYPGVWVAYKDKE